MLLIMIYHTLHHHATRVEIGSLMFFALSVHLAFGRAAWFLRWGSAIGSAFQGLLWLSSAYQCGLSQYAENAKKKDFTQKEDKTSWINPANPTIHLMWGYQFILTTNLRILTELLTKLKTPLTICRYTLVGPTIFLTWLSKRRSGVPPSAIPKRQTVKLKQQPSSASP